MGVTGAHHRWSVRRLLPVLHQSPGDEVTVQEHDTLKSVKVLRNTAYDHCTPISLTKAEDHIWLCLPADEHLRARKPALHASS